MVLDEQIVALHCVCVAEPRLRRGVLVIEIDCVQKEADRLVKLCPLVVILADTGKQLGALGSGHCPDVFGKFERIDGCRSISVGFDLSDRLKLLANLFYGVDPLRLSAFWLDR